MVFALALWWVSLSMASTSHSEANCRSVLGSCTTNRSRKQPPNVATELIDRYPTVSHEPGKNRYQPIAEQKRHQRNRDRARSEERRVGKECRTRSTANE